MLNIAVARKAVDAMRINGNADLENCRIISKFIDSVEKLMTENSIKQQPAIFSPFNTLNS